MTVTQPDHVVVNGVNTTALFATLDAVREAPQAAQFTFRVANEWVEGTYSRGRIEGFFGVGQEQDRAEDFVVEADHPEVLVGGDRAPTPAELLLSALAACLTAGIGNIAAARGVQLTSVRSTVEGDIDLNGILGLSDEVRNGFANVTVRFAIEGDASPEVLSRIVQQSVARSAVFDVMTNGVPVAVEVATP